MNKYSIILPVHNGGDYLKECVNSILNQSRQDYNLHILDNCSSDGSLEWIASLHSDKIIIHRCEHSLSIEANWARIATINKNEFMTIIGHDDILHNGYLQTMSELIEKHPDASLYQAHFRFIDLAGKFIGSCLPMDEVQYAHEFIAAHFMKTMNSMGTGYMMRSKDYDALGGIPDYPNLIFADYELWIGLCSKNYKATTLSESFSYRVHNSVSRLTAPQAYIEAFERYVMFLSNLSKQNRAISMIIERYGRSFLLDYCESLSHRLLKTPINTRKIKVHDFIEKCRQLALILIPGQEFEPMNVYRIRIAKKLDAHIFSRTSFQLFKKLTK